MGNFNGHFKRKKNVTWNEASKKMQNKNEWAEFVCE